MGGDSERSQVIRLLAYGLLMGLLFSELFVFAWCRTECVNIGYECEELAREKDLLKERQKALKVELAHLRSPDRIIKIGEEKLGLGMPRSDQIVVVPYDNQKN